MELGYRKFLLLNEFKLLGIQTKIPNIINIILRGNFKQLSLGFTLALIAQNRYHILVKWHGSSHIFVVV